MPLFKKAVEKARKEAATNEGDDGDGSGEAEVEAEVEVEEEGDGAAEGLGDLLSDDDDINSEEEEEEEAQQDGQREQEPAAPDYTMYPVNTRERLGHKDRAFALMTQNNGWMHGFIAYLTRGGEAVHEKHQNIHTALLTKADQLATVFVAFVKDDWLVRRAEAIRAEVRAALAPIQAETRLKSLSDSIGRIHDHMVYPKHLKRALVHVANYRKRPLLRPPDRQRDMIALVADQITGGSNGNMKSYDLHETLQMVLDAPHRYLTPAGLLRELYRVWDATPGVQEAMRVIITQKKGKKVTTLTEGQFRLMRAMISAALQGKGEASPRLVIRTCVLGPLGFTVNVYCKKVHVAGIIGGVALGDEVNDAIRVWAAMPRGTPLPDIARDGAGSFKGMGRLVLDPTGSLLSLEGKKDLLRNKENVVAHDFGQVNETCMVNGVITDDAFRSTNPAILINPPFFFTKRRKAQLMQVGARKGASTDVDKAYAGRLGWHGRRMFLQSIRDSIIKLAGHGAIVILGNGHKRSELGTYLEFLFGLLLLRVGHLFLLPAVWPPPQGPGGLRRRPHHPLKGLREPGLSLARLLPSPGR